jgi:hypothetical protein
VRRCNLRLGGRFGLDVVEAADRDRHPAGPGRALGGRRAGAVAIGSYPAFLALALEVPRGPVRRDAKLAQLKFGAPPTF